MRGFFGCTFVALASFGHSVTFFDEFFVPGGLVSYEAPYTVWGGAIHGGGVTPSGNPGGALFLRTFAEENFGIVSASGAERHLISKTFQYSTETHGALSTVNFSLDLRTLDAPGIFSVPPPASIQRILLRQNSTIYYGDSDAISNPEPMVWTTYSRSGMTSQDFYSSTGAHPDFSASASAIEVGLHYKWDFVDFDPYGVVDHHYDNLRIELNPVPEPSSLVLAVVLVTGISRRKATRPI